MSDELFDFGFTFADESDIEAVQVATEKVAETANAAESTQAKLDKLFNAIQPLLNNLKQNPEKDYIKWAGADRLAKIEAFEDHIPGIYQGTK